MPAVLTKGTNAAVLPMCTELSRVMPVDIIEYTSASMGANMMGMMNFVITCFGERESKSACIH